MSGTRKLAGATLVAALVVAGAGCGKAAEKVSEKAAEKAAEQAAGGNVDINSDDGSVKITDDQGNVTEIGGASLPDGWPDELKPPDSVKIVSASTNTIDGKKSLFALGEADGSMEDYYQGVKTQLTDAGYDIQSDTMTSATDGGYAGVSATNGTYDVTVSITTGDSADKTNISFSVTESASS